jgi:secreted PhoX family phosphatase
MNGLGRRAFLRGAVATTGGVLVSGPLQTLLADAVSAMPDGPLGPVADLRDGIVRLHLRPGFQYRSFHDNDTLWNPPVVPPPPTTGPQPPQAPVILPDGTRLPGRHDGMAAFAGPDGNVWLVRNHEVNGPVAAAFGPNPAGPADTPYDSRAGGGTTTSLVTPRGEVIDAFTSLNGTQMNCSGGRMPWGSWITCEETVNGPDTTADFTGVSNAPLQKPHGFIFEVPASGKSTREPVKHAGRFAHEAAGYSPDEGIVYLTEDNFEFQSGFYRYTPPENPMTAGHLADGGTLEMLKVVGATNAHLEAHQEIGATYAVEWVPIANPFPGPPDGDGRFTTLTDNKAALNFVGNQGRAQGAAYFSRLEGATFTRGEIYFTSTQGGGPADTVPQTVRGFGQGTGQVWSYDPSSSTLTCRYQAPNAAALELPDNITARNDRGTIVICEDGPVENYIRALSRQSTLSDIALNRLRDNNPHTVNGEVVFVPRFGEEFAGATFSADGGTLFVNIQASRGVTFAIWGPWGRLGV